MDGLAPDLRGRIAFTALIFSIYLIAADRSLAAQDLSPLYLIAPAIAVVAVGQSTGREALFRAGISVAALAAASMLVTVADGRALPDYHGFSLALYALTGIFALNLAIIAITSLVVRHIWPASDRWTR